MEVLSLQTATENGLLDKLMKQVDTSNISVGSANCLQNARIEYVWEIAAKTEAEMRKVKKCSQKYFNELRNNVLSDLGLSFGMQFSAELCEEIHRQCGRGPTSPAEAAADEPVDETTDVRALKPSELVLVAPGLLKARLKRLNQESDLLRGLLWALEAGLTVLVTDTTPEPVRRFMEETRDEPTVELVRKRREIISKEIKDVSQVLLGAWTGTTIRHQVSAALKLLE